MQLIFDNAIRGNQELNSSVNKWTSKVQSFISFGNTFFLFVQENQKMHYKNKDIKSFT